MTGRERAGEMWGPLPAATTPQKAPSPLTLRALHEDSAQVGQDPVAPPEPVLAQGGCTQGLGGMEQLLAEEHLPLWREWRVVRGLHTPRRSNTNSSSTRSPWPASRSAAPAPGCWTQTCQPGEGMDQSEKRPPRWHPQVCPPTEPRAPHLLFPAVFPSPGLLLLLHLQPHVLGQAGAAPAPAVLQPRELRLRTARFLGQGHLQPARTQLEVLGTCPPAHPTPGAEMKVLRGCK